MIEIVFGIVGLFIAGLTYKKTYLDKPKEEIEHFIVQFKATQSTSLKVRKELLEYAERNEAFKVDFIPGITIESYLVIMEESFKENLSNELLDKTLKLNPSKLLLSSMSDSLSKQLQELIQIEIMLKAARLHSKGT